MLFISVFTWEPEKRDEVVKRRKTEKIPPEGLKIIGEWADLGSNRVFRLFDVTDPEVILAASFPWNDLGNVELVPVMETEEVLKLLPKSVAGIVVEV